MPVRKSTATWEGDLPKGKGTMVVGNGAYQGPYSFSSRFENGQGTNPEELVAAAHAGCFAMALSNELAKAGYTPTRVDSEARVHLDKTEGGFGVSHIDLLVEADVPGIDEALFQEKAQGAKAGCPISRLLSAVEITLDAKLKK